MVGNGRASAVAKIKPMAGFARFDLQPPERLKNGGMTPDIAERLSGYSAGPKVGFLEKGARIDAALRRNATGQFACPAHIQPQGPALFCGDGKEGVTGGYPQVLA
jgi:hypothetical protein